MSLPSIQQGGSSFHDSSRMMNDLGNNGEQIGSPEDLTRLKKELVQVFDIHEKQKIAISKFQVGSPEKSKTINTHRSTNSAYAYGSKSISDYNSKKDKAQIRLDKKHMLHINERIKEMRKENSIVSMMGLSGDIKPVLDQDYEPEQSLTARFETEKFGHSTLPSARPPTSPSGKGIFKTTLSDNFTRNFIMKPTATEKIVITSPARTFSAIKLNMRSIQLEAPSPTRSANIYRMKNSYEKIEKFKLMNSNRSIGSSTAPHTKSENTTFQFPEKHDPIKSKLIAIVSQDIDAANEPIPIYPPTEKMIESLREENFRPITASVTTQVVSPNSGRSTKRSLKKYGMTKPPTEKHERDMLSNFLQSPFVNELIHDKYHRRIEEKKMSSFEEIRKLILENRMIKLRQQVDVDNYQREIADQLLRKENYEKYKTGSTIPPKDFTRNTVFEVFTPDNSFELKTGLKSAYNIPNQDTARRKRAKKTETLVFQTLNDIDVVKALRSLQNMGNEAQKIDEMQGKVLAEKLMKNKFKRIRLCISATLKEWGKLYIPKIKDIAEKKIFPKEPYEKPGSYEFIKAAKFGEIKKIVHLLKKDRYHVFSFDQVGQTALHWAAKRGHWEICKVLIDFGAEVNREDIAGKTPLFFALKNGRDEVTRILFINDADPWSKRTNLEYRSNCGSFFCAKSLSLARQFSIIMTFYSSKEREKHKGKLKEIFDGDNLLKIGNLLTDEVLTFEKPKIKETQITTQNTEEQN